MSSSRSTSPNPGGGLGGSLRAAWRRSTSFTGLSDALASGKGGKPAGAGGASPQGPPSLALARSKSGIALAARSAALIGADGEGSSLPGPEKGAVASNRPPRPAALVTGGSSSAAGGAPSPSPAKPVGGEEVAPVPSPAPSARAASAAGAGPRNRAATPSPSRALSGAAAATPPVHAGPVDEAGEPLPPGVLPDGALWFEEGSVLDEAYGGDAAAYAGAAAAAARVRYAAYTAGTLTGDGLLAGWACAHADPVRGRPCATPGCRGAADPALAATPPETPVARLGVAIAPAAPPGIDLPFWKPASPAVQAGMVAGAAGALALGQWELVAAALSPLASLSWSPGALAATTLAVLLLIGAGIPEAVAGGVSRVAARARRAARAPTAAAHRVVGVIDALGTLPILLARLEVEIAAMKDDIRSIRGKADWLPSRGGGKGGGKAGGKAVSESGGGLTAALVAAVAASAAAGVPLVPAVPTAPVVGVSVDPHAPVASAFAPGMRRAASDAEVFTWAW